MPKQTIKRGFQALITAKRGSRHTQNQQRRVMKHFILLLSLAFMLSACGGHRSETVNKLQNKLMTEKIRVKTEEWRELEAAAKKTTTKAACERIKTAMRAKRIEIHALMRAAALPGPSPPHPFVCKENGYVRSKSKAVINKGPPSSSKEGKNLSQSDDYDGL